MITLHTIIPATPAQIYAAWLDGKKHAAMTGGKATGSAKVGSKFTAWDGYIWGKNVKLLKDKLIVQAWRTSEFSDDDPDSTLTITLTKIKSGTKLSLKHGGTPKTQEASYRSGWHEHYFDPMQEYFASR
ncbi:MAG: SRPBCC domain-containing protein [Candidatus Kerfeldbacteria bacterium]|nr:SRPBCC domain-containing protein [Candidatus Kerfeldbacteria bacterium]